MTSTPKTIDWRNGELHLLDQRKLPQHIEYLSIDTIEAAWEAIATLAVRGAPAIGVAAAYALVATSPKTGTADQFLEILHRNATYLNGARPTAVNLSWAINRIVRRAEAEPSWSAICNEAASIHAEDIVICDKIGDHGAGLITAGANLLTHCNAGSLAVSGIGTATAPMYRAHNAGVKFHVYADETRPLFQGARLTVWELNQAGIDTTLICDNAAASLMAGGKIDLAIVGCDRVASNGDVINKIGTLNVAILCHHFQIPFYVACPSSTFDSALSTGAEAPIEQRDSAEVLAPVAAAVNAANPAFDVTPAKLVTGLISENGIVQQPNSQALKAHFSA